MKKALMKDSIKQIKNTSKRFLSILMMAFLGVGFFAGIKATSPDMVHTIDRYYKEQNVYDIEIVSTLGLTNNDLSELAKISDIDILEGTYEKDAKIQNNNEEVIVKLLCSNEINKPVLIEGNLPNQINECVVEEQFLKNRNMQIGDFLSLEVEDSINDEGATVSYLNENKVKIVGTVKSPLYISSDRGTSSLGTGSVDYYIYISESNINYKDVYTRIYAKLKDSNKYITSSDEYEKYVESVKSNIEAIKNDREQARYNELIETATNKVDEAEKQFNTEKEDNQKKIEEAENELNDAKAKIDQAEVEITKNEQNADNTFKTSEEQIKTAKSELSKSKSELSSKEEETNKQFQELEKQKSELSENLNNIITNLTQAENKYNQIVEELNKTDLSDTNRQELIKTKTELYAQITELNKNKTEIEFAISRIEKGLFYGKNELESAKTEISKAEAEIEKNEKVLEKNKRQTYQKIEEAKTELENSKIELKNGEEELEKNKIEFETKINDAEKELIDARSKLSDIETPKWYIFDRYNNDGYNSYIQDTNSIRNIGNVFPIVFFIVATLISLNSMTRMVEEQRAQIGTLNALGYNKFQIISKYVLYASLATIIGGILGMIVGFILIPSIIFKMYQIMYSLSGFKTEFNIYYGALGLGLISVCIISATIYSAVKELINTPATLMRPKSPKVGKRVLLEHIPFIWNKLTFTRKVTVRNIFRYKKRFLMTIIGILGCTSLIVTGFGIKNSIKGIIDIQYDNVFNYDMQITLKNGMDNSQKSEYIHNLEAKDEIENIVSTYMTSATAKNEENSEDVIIIVPEDQLNLNGLINIKDLKTNEIVNLNKNEICLTDKVAQLLDVKQGDTIKLTDSDDKEVNVKVSNIVENYVYHYVYMTPETYKNLFGKEYSTNMLFTKNKQLSDEQLDELSKSIMSDNEVSGVSVLSTITSQLDKTMNSLNYVVVVLIVAAGLLAFVVLYNLQNVNISERIRELATIKVLGFYNKEVYSYVTRETILLTIIGIALGLIGGYFLNSFILTTCEINMLRFKAIIEPKSFVFSILITAGFSIIVNIATYFALKKIDMIESLKSIE